MGHLGKTICGLFLRDVFRQYSLLLRNFLFIFLANDSWMVNFKCDMCTLIYIFKNSYLYYLRSFILTRKSYILGFGNYLIYFTKGGRGTKKTFCTRPWYSNLHVSMSNLLLLMGVFPSFSAEILCKAHFHFWV